MASVLDLPRQQLTPGMQQYQDVKREHPDCVVMLRMGDFYEMFYDDAVLAARELEITLTARGQGDKRAPLAGIPFHALENYLGRLIRKGYKVALVEQLEDPKKAKGLVKRGVTRIITPGTIIEQGLLTEKENNYLASVVAREGYALAVCDVSTGEFCTLMLENSIALHNEIARYHPSEIVIPESLQVNAELVSALKSFGLVNARADYFFSQDKAGEVLQQHFRTSLAALGLEKSENIAAAGGLLHYLLETQKNSLAHLQKITVQSRETMILDQSTLRNLELLRNREGDSKGTLLMVLDQTQTSGGGRLLRQWIKAPLLNVARIQERLQAVEELFGNVILSEELRDLLKQTHDLERLLARVHYGTANPKDLLVLKSTLEVLPKVVEKLQACRSNLLPSIARLDCLPELYRELQQALRADAPLTVREGGIFNAGYQPELDTLQQLSTNSQQYLQQLEQQERSKTGIAALKISYTNVFGYFIEVTKKNLSLVPAHYIRKQTTANGERYITPELKAEEEKILGAQERQAELEFQLFQQLLQKVMAPTPAIQDAAAKIAVLDVLLAFATVARQNRYVRPRFTDEKILSITRGRHPVVEQLQPQFVGNEVMLADGEMMIITGPNMSGKSTCMRQTALIVLLAQMGSFVPADSCTLGIVDRVFTRVGAYDDLSSGQSTFMVEMNETAAILNYATERSLVILDEIGRGTSTFDGVSIAWSVAEHIHNQIKAKTLFATHYHVLNKLAENFSRVKNYHVAVKEVNKEVVFLHRLVEGGTDASYGIHVAELAGLPSEVVTRAKEVLSVLEKDDEMVRRMKAKRLEVQKGLGEF